MTRWLGVTLLLGGFLGGCGSSEGTPPVVDGGTDGTVCASPKEMCSGSCVDVKTDPAHCGTCGNACKPGEVCSAGSCSLTCGGGTTRCGTLCVNTDNDPTNCGTCDNTCNDGEVCSAGQCGLQCSGGTTKCGTLCVDTDNDPANCGTCDNTCNDGEVCSAGQCGLQCLGGTTKCGTLCVNTDINPAHCGTCDNACPSGEVCSAGQCGLQCVGGTTKCGTACVNTATDPANCGVCDKVCLSGEICTIGNCESICGAGLTLCGTSCVNMQTDVAHCGACTTVCSPGDKCITGQCQPCDSTTTDCDGDGWLVSEGDCCDKPGLCGTSPELVNPGAIEVVGNGIDDNCNGKADLFDTADTVPCDSTLVSSSTTATDFAKALGLCRSTVETPATKKDRTWGLISAQLLRADATTLGTEHRGHSIRPAFGGIVPNEGQRMVVLSSGVAADATQTSPGPNGGAPTGYNVSTSQGNNVNISTCTQPLCIKDWFSTANPPLKAANALPVAPSCGSGTAGSPTLAQDSVMLVLRLRAPTNAKAFSFNSYFFSAEYPEYVCSSFNDQIIALVNTPVGTPSVANPVDKNLMTYTSGNQRWPIGINIAKGTSLFAVCESQATNAECWDTNVSTSSCSLGAGHLTDTGFETPTASSCTIGGGTYWLTTSGNVVPGEIVELRIAIWDVGDMSFDSLVLIDGFKWLSSATLPGTG